MQQEKENFEKEFVGLNCEVQNLKMKNESLLDEIMFKQEALANLDADIMEKTKLVKYYEDEIQNLDV